MDLTQALTEVLKNTGAALVGISDVSGVPGCDYAAGVSVAIPVPVPVLKDLMTAPTMEYYNTYNTMNRKLDAIILAGEAFLREKGFRAMARTKALAVIDGQNRTSLPHKTAAALAGLGWIGKSDLLVTPEYGSAVRISTILTDAPLEACAPVLESRCGNCRVCVDACPAHALKGALWHAGLARDEIVDLEKCCGAMSVITQKAFGISTDICGKCFAVCPFTQRYVKRQENLTQASSAGGLTNLENLV